MIRSEVLSSETPASICSKCEEEPPSGCVENYHPLRQRIESVIERYVSSPDTCVILSSALAVGAVVQENPFLWAGAIGSGAFSHLIQMLTLTERSQK